MLLVAARHLDSTQGATRYAAITARLITPLIRLSAQELHEASWSEPADTHRQPLPPGTAQIVPLYLCHISGDSATFHLLTTYRDQTAYLVEALRTRPPADLSSRDAPAWAQRVYDEQASVNIGPPRIGLRLTAQAEIEAKLTVSNQHDPLALAVRIGSVLGSRSAGLTHRILRSQLYAPAAPTGYAAFTRRPDTGWWAKAKHAASASGPAAPAAAMRSEQHHVVPDLDAGLAWASAALGCELHLIGTMHRTCWDQLTDPDSNGDMCVVTADRARLGQHILQQIEIEYSGRLAGTGPDAARAQQHVDATAEAVARALTSAGISCDRDNLTKIDFFRDAGESHVC